MARPQVLDTRDDSTTGSSGVIRVFIVDDHEVVRDGLRYQFVNDPSFAVVGEAGTVADGRAGLLATRPDVAIVDVRLPDGNGIELVREVRSVDAGIASLMFTSHPADAALFQSLLAGAAGYLVKDASTEEIHEAVRVAASGGTLVDRTTLDRLRAIPMAEDARLPSDLTPQERRILDLVTQGLTNREIAERFGLAEKTVRNYVSTILGKMGLRNRVQAAAYVARASAHMAVTGGRFG